MGGSFAITDVETGETKKLTLSESRISFGRKYMAVFLENLDILAKNKSLTATDMRVFFYLLSRVEYENRLWHIRQKMICDELRMTKSQVSKSIKQLVDLMVIEKDKNGLMSLSMDYVWRGKAAVYLTTKKEREAAAKREREEACELENELI